MHFIIEGKNIKKSFYIHVFGNSFFIEKIEKSFFNEKNIENNFKLLEKYYLEFIQFMNDNVKNKNKVDDNEIKDSMNVFLKRNIRDVFYNIHSRTLFTEYFIANIYYGMIRELFKDEEHIRLLCLLEGHPDSDFASVIKKEELPWFINCLKQIESNENIRPVSYFRNNSNPFSEIIELYENNSLNEDLIIKNDRFKDINLLDLRDYPEDYYDYFYLFYDQKIDDKEEYKSFVENYYLDENEEFDEDDCKSIYLLNKAEPYEVEKKYILDRKYNVISKDFLNEMRFNGKEFSESLTK
ncbi:MAG: hypothetical protein CL760_01765 [Chloroflexi bacterium]|nr:hypothetical protein [Chloroflexota bacterium]|tara:strand:+ start:29702 stop:30589 length:888 start_codon:yes stop_codon:yes gene_type:complete